MTLNQQKILSTLEAQHWLVDAADQDVAQIDFCSAYVKKTSLEFFHSNYLKSGLIGSARLLARWKPLDLISGASDLEVYEYCRANGIRFFIKEDFHGKLYQVKPKGLLIGSFNLTNSGFGLHQNSNDEAGVIIDISEKNAAYVNDLFLDSTEMTDGLYEKIKAFIFKNQKEESAASLHWDVEIADLLKPLRLPSNLLVGEFFYAPPPNSAEISLENEHDISVLGIAYEDLSSDLTIQKAFKRSIPYIWLRKILIDNNGELYFGGITKQLHDCLIDDPTPYRKDVKRLVQNLVSWVERYGLDDFVVDIPSHSQRIRLNNIS